MEELLDIVDEYNQPTGESAPRADIHARKLLHRVANLHLFYVKDSTLYLLCHRRAGGVGRYPGRWDPAAGGHIRSGMTPQKTALEETFEEFGISVPSEKLWEGPCLKIEDLDERKFNYFFYTEVTADITVQADPKEVAETKFIKLKDIYAGMQKTPTAWTGSSERFKSIITPLVDRLQAEGKL